MDMRSHLGRARGLGSSNDGVGHWWMQRLTGIALVPLIIWFVYSAVTMTGASHAEFSAWVGTHGNPILLILLIIAMFHHGQLGLQVVIEDYIHSEGPKLALIILTKFAAIFIGASSIFAVLRLTFGGS
ncbi:MAG: succinate dehydrogenase, hydrophobic membrane anchor protein [Rhodospirillales bacterium]|nr:succinate dehydrogenase, hydrophobic membrane anchor protein [Rhodospirillales bacterium]